MSPGQVRLGHSEVHVTPLVFGGAPIGGLFAPVSEADARATLNAGWAAGIRAFDTAPHYGAGLSEQRLGGFLCGRPRAGFTICTKVGRRLVPADGVADGTEGFYGAPQLARVRDYSRDGVLASLEDSLARLGLDRVDIVLIHDPEDYAAQALDEAYPALAELRAAGVVGAVGVGMNEAGPLEWFVRRTDLDCVLVAGRYTLLDTSAAESLFPECLRRGVAVLAAGVFNSGVLASPAAGCHLRLHGGGPGGAGPRPAARGHLRTARRAAARRRAAVLAGPPGGDRGGGGRAQPGRDHAGRQLPDRRAARRPARRAGRGRAAARPGEDAGPGEDAAGGAAAVIVDAHHHVWDPAAREHEWLASLPSLRRRFSVADFVSASAPHGVTASVLVQVPAGLSGRLG